MSRTTASSGATAGERPAVDERLVVLALAVAAFALNLNANVDATLAPFWSRSYGWSKHQLGLLQSAAGYAGAVGALTLGPLVDRIGRRPTLLAGLGLFTLASAGHCATASYLPLLVLRALAGAAVGVAYASASAALADLVPYERRAGAMGRFSTGLFLAIPLGLPMAVLLASIGAWQAVFGVQAVIGGLALLAARRTVPPARGTVRRAAPVQVLRQPMVPVSLLAVLLYVGGFTSAVRFLGVWLDETGVLARGDQWSLWVAFGLASAAGSLYLARLGDRVGKRRHVLASSLVVAVLFLLLVGVEGLAALVAVGLPLAVVAASRTGPLQALMSEIVPVELRGTMMGLRSAAMLLGIGLFADTGGRLYDAFGYPALLYQSVAGVAASWLLVLVGMRRMA